MFAAAFRFLLSGKGQGKTHYWVYLLNSPQTK
jgi:hypothetical protein